MKKFVLFTDHFASHNSDDAFIEINAKNFIEAFNTASEMFNDTMYLIRIYEVVKGTRGKEYRRIANVVNYRELETKDINNDIIKRFEQKYNNGKIDVWFD